VSFDPWGLAYSFGKSLATPFFIHFFFHFLSITTYCSYSIGALAMLTASLVMMERLNTQQNISALELIYLNSFNCLCLFLIADIVQDEVHLYVDIDYLKLMELN
jgi:hypothetical protein